MGYSIGVTIKGADVEGQAGVDVLAGEVLGVDQGGVDLIPGKGVFLLFRVSVFLQKGAQTVMQYGSHVLLDAVASRPSPVRSVHRCSPYC